MGNTTQVIFKVGEERYGFDIKLVIAIENYTGIVPIPNAPENILGMINLRGDIIPIFSLRKKFGMTEILNNEKTQLIITRIQDMPVGFKVDSVEEIQEIKEAELHPMPIITKADETTYAKCVASKNRKLIILINNDGIISAGEKKMANMIIENNTPSQ